MTNEDISRNIIKKMMFGEFGEYSIDGYVYDLRQDGVFLTSTPHSDKIYINSCVKFISSSVRKCLSDFKSVKISGGENLLVIGDLFRDNKIIESVDLYDFNSKFPIVADSLFFGCSNLKDVRFPENSKIKLKSCTYMFGDCISLKSIDLSSFDTSEIRSLDFMFEGCSSLEHLDLSSFDTSSCMCFSHMFCSCKSLERLDLSDFDLSNARYLVNMFADCESLVELNIKPLLDKSKIVMMGRMFDGCLRLKKPFWYGRSKEDDYDIEEVH